MHNQSVHDLGSDKFEWVCGGIIASIATDLGASPTGPPELMAPTSDGGIEAKVPTKTGYLGVQCKAYSNFVNEVNSAKASFETFLNSPEHAAVKTYVWCSTAYRTSGTGATSNRKTGNDKKSQDAIKDMLELAAQKSRAVKVVILFAGDLDRIIREHRPEYFAVMAARAPLLPGDVERYSAARASDILSRLGGDQTPQLEFPAPRTAQVLDRLVASWAQPRAIGTSWVKELLGEVKRRTPSEASHSDIRTDFRATAELVGDAGLALTQLRETPVDEASSLLKILQDEVDSAIEQVLSEIRRHRSLAEASPAVDIHLDVALGRIRAYGRSLVALSADLDLLRCEIEAALSGSLLIAGRWGTGKSFQLAEFTRRTLERGTPVLLLRARDFTLPDAPILAQPWRGSFNNEHAEPAEIATMLDAIGHREGTPLHLVIDGLNESSIRDLPIALSRLQETIAHHPNLRLIISTRQDRISTESSRIPKLLHESPDQVTLSRSVERALHAPPGTPWHAALANPLLASVAVLVLSVHPGESDRLLSRTALFNAWVDLLADETARVLRLQEATIKRVIEAISKAGGECTITDLASPTRLNSDLVDDVVQRLADEGLLETNSSTADTVRFRWEAMTEMLRARRAIRDDTIDEFLTEVEDDRRPGRLSLVAELVPREKSTHELPDFELSSVSTAERDLAFALSLGRRAESEIHERTLQVAERLLHTDGDASQGIVHSVLSMPRRQRLGFAWLSRLLCDSTIAKRSRYWPQALEDLCDRSQADQDNLEQLLSWYATEHWPSLAREDASTAIELLAWIGCANVRTDLPAFAVRSLTELLEKYPEQFEVILEHLQDVDDDHPRDTLLAAATGAIARWPHSHSASVLHDACSRARGLNPLPQSYRSLAALYTATDSRLPIHKFLGRSLPPLKRNPLFRTRSLIHDDDRAMFADDRSVRQAERFESQILSTFRIDRKRLESSLRSSQERPGYDHGASLVYGRWLARQYAEHAAGDRLFTPLGSVKAGTPGNRSAKLLVDPDDAWDHPTDPTVPLALMLHGSDTVKSDHWWAVRSAGNASLKNELHVMAPNGVEWVVIDGLFRVLSPQPQGGSDRPALRLGFGRWTLPEDDDGRPLPGRTRHDVIHVNNAVFNPTPDSSQYTGVERKLTRSWFADSFARASSDGKLVPMWPEGGVDPLTAGLLQLLGAQWTGWGRDCVDATGELVVTDPAVGRSAPHAVLIRRDSLDSALKCSGQQITVQVTVTNNLVLGMHHSKTASATFGGPESTVRLNDNLT